MAELDISKTTTTDLNIQPYSTGSQGLEYSEGKDVYVDFPNTAKYLGYYKRYGQLKKAIDTLWIYVVGKGMDTDTTTKVKLDYIKGVGEDTLQNILWNMGVMSMIAGDSFAEIIRAKAEDGEDRLVNLKPISPERMRVVYGLNGLIKGYEQVRWAQDGKAMPYKKFKPEQILHLCNDRIGDEQRGTSVIECCSWVIDAIEEARRDYRVVLHRNVVPVRIIEVDTDDRTERNRFMAEYKSAIQKGEVLVIPKGTVAFSQDKITIQDPINWIQSLENYFYLAVGIPRVIASPDALSEGASKVGYLIFEPIYTFRQVLMEQDLWQQLGVRIKFRRPPSLQDNMQENEAKNTSQTGFQPKDTEVNMERE
jgi:hypothetical protein